MLDDQTGEVEPEEEEEAPAVKEYSSIDEAYTDDTIDAMAKWEAIKAMLDKREAPLTDLGEFFDNRFREKYAVESMDTQVKTTQRYVEQLAEAVGIDIESFTGPADLIYEKAIETIRSRPDFDIEKYREILTKAMGADAAAMLIMHKIGAVLNRKNKRLLDTAIDALETIRKNSLPAEEEEKATERAEREPCGEDVNLEELTVEARGEDDDLTVEEAKAAIGEWLEENVGEIIDKKRGRIKLPDKK